MPGRSLRGLVIAGHGGDKPGAIDPTGYGDTIHSVEKNITLPVAKSVRTALQRAGALMDINRTGDVTQSLQFRAWLQRRGYRIGAGVCLPYDFSVAIHANRVTSEGPRGVEVYRYWHDAIALANPVYNELAKVSLWPDRGVKYAPFYVIRRGIKNSILVELGFQSNTEEEKLLVDAEYQKILGEAITKGVLRRFNAPYVPPIAPDPVVQALIAPLKTTQRMMVEGPMNDAGLRVLWADDGTWPTTLGKKGGDYFA